MSCKVQQSVLNLIFGESQSMAGPAILTSGPDREVSELESESLARHISLIIPDYFRYNISDYGRIDPTLTVTRATIETRNHTQFDVTFFQFASNLMQPFPTPYFKGAIGITIFDANLS